jgi:hypothetical protein
VAACAECRAQLDKLQALDAMLALDEDVAESAAFDQKVLQAIAAERPSFWAKWVRPQVLAPVMAAAIAAGVFLLVQPSEPSEDELFMAQNHEMLAELDLLQELPAVEEAGDDFAVISALPEIEKGGE